MKLLVISHEYPPIGGGGGKVVQDVCSGLAAHGYQVRVLTARFGDLPASETHNNLVIERLASARTQAYRAGLKAMACFVWRAFWRGLRVIRQWQPDLIHAHFAVPAGAAAYALSLCTGVPYVLTAHGGDVPGGAPEKTGGWFRFVLPLSKPVWRRAKAAAAVSSRTRELALQHYQADIRIIPNGIDPAAYQPGAYDASRPAAVIYIGRFSPEKNPLAVPQSLAALKNLDWRCVMLGDGPQMAEVRAAIDTAGLQERFTLPGWVQLDEVAGWMEKSDILLMPSLREAMPMAGLQALAMGLALVASRMGSLPDLVSEGVNGFLVEPGDVPGYAAAIKKLITDRALLQSFRAASRARAAQFDMAQVLDAYEALYQKALAS